MQNFAWFSAIAASHNMNPHHMPSNTVGCNLDCHNPRQRRREATDRTSAYIVYHCIMSFSSDSEFPVLETVHWRRLSQDTQGGAGGTLPGPPDLGLQLPFLTPLLHPLVLQLTFINVQSQLLLLIISARRPIP